MKSKFPITLCFILFYLSAFETKAQEFAEIPRINSTAVIDGIADDVWKSLPPHPIIYLIDGKSYPDTTDCSGYFKAFWNRDTLYVLIFALDNQLFTNASTVWTNDGFEIYLNVNFTKDTVYTDNCYQFRFIPGSEEISGRWGLDVWTPPTVDFAIVVNEAVSRTIEAVFPLVQLLGKETPVAEGDSMGFEIEILDNDGSGRDHVLSWNNNEHMAYYNPTKMGTIRFTESTISSIDDFQPSVVSIYPNPVTGSLFVSAQSAIEEIVLYSIQGEILNIQTSLSIASLSYDMSNYRAGIYIMRLKLENGGYLNYKILKKD